MPLSRKIPQFVFVVLLLAACAPTPKRVVLVVDGTRRVVDTFAVTVQDVLREQRITLNDDDRVEPPLLAEVERSATITVTRVVVQTETTLQPIPFVRELVHDESYPENQMHIVQLGSNGEVQITYTVTSENGQPPVRHETARRVVSEPKNEILAIGTRGSLPIIPLMGSVVYLASGNAWVMRNSSTDKRPLTTTGDLDGRVFSLSADGRYLLFSRAEAASSSTFNSLWLIDTLVLGDTPRALAAGDVLYGQLANDASAIVYSTGEKTSGAPGWKAHNDLWLTPLPPLAGETGTQANPIKLNSRSLWKPGIPAPYGWWGAQFALAPDGRAIAYAFPNEIGFSEIGTLGATGAARQPLSAFAPFRTPGDWVWAPQVAWSPDSRYVIAAVHAPLDPPAVASDNPVFEVWALARDGTVRAPLAKQTGMWSAPVWSPPDANGESRIAYGVALSPSDSERSRYALYVMDRDGGNKVQIFPSTSENGLSVVQIAWAPSAGQLIAVRDNDLWLYDFGAGRWSQLTANGASALPRWGR